jgi:hypothetical protein
MIVFLMHALSTTELIGGVDEQLRLALEGARFFS